MPSPLDVVVGLITHPDLANLTPLTYAQIFGEGSSFLTPADFGILPAQLSGIYWEASAVPDGYGRYIGFNSLAGDRQGDRYPDGLGQIQLFHYLADQTIVPVERVPLEYEQQVIRPDEWPIAAIGLYLQPGVFGTVSALAITLPTVP